VERSFVTVAVDADGRLIVPADIARRQGIAPGARVRIREDEGGLRISRSTASLTRVYVEPTTGCNLSCRACIRSAWEEPLGFMDGATWARALAGIREIDPLPSLFLGGYGEPLQHPDILCMIAHARAAGLSVELITNGTLLDGRVADRMVEAGLDRIWVSIDAEEQSVFARSRGGGAIHAVSENVQRLNAARERALSDTPRVGISFVATRDTISSLPRVLRLGVRLMADRFLVSNVLPHTRELNEQALYHRSFHEPDIPPSERTPLVELPRMELNRETESPLAEVLKGPFTVSVARQRLLQGSCTCPFAETGSLAVRWDGEVSPCLPLMHRHTSFLQDRRRSIYAFSVGNVATRSLRDIWNDPAYVGLRERLLDFDFAPCTICNSCEEADGNRSDCFGNGPPACGGCLWAQGFIQCP
jgi:MoaA/NifB/PqqE/SkfB family radical SAM enzyme